MFYLVITLYQIMHRGYATVYGRDCTTFILRTCVTLSDIKNLIYIAQAFKQLPIDQLGKKMYVHLLHVH